MRQPGLPFGGVTVGDVVAARAPMARATDPNTSHRAAEVVRPELGKIQREVLEAFRSRGPMTARQAERLPRFDCYGFSTVRKRISELRQAGYLVVIRVEGTASIYDVPL